MSIRNNLTQHHEASDWLKRLDVMQQENVRLKTLIADVIRKDDNRHTLEQAEAILNSIINKDAVIALLRRDIAQYIRGNESTKADHMQNKLSEDIGKMQGELKKLGAELACFIGSSA